MADANGSDCRRVTIAPRCLVSSPNCMWAVTARNLPRRSQVVWRRNGRPQSTVESRAVRRSQHRCDTAACDLQRRALSLGLVCRFISSAVLTQYTTVDQLSTAIDSLDTASSFVTQHACHQVSIILICCVIIIIITIIIVYMTFFPNDVIRRFFPGFDDILPIQYQ